MEIVYFEGSAFLLKLEIVRNNVWMYINTRDD
jgi:hypothetical protein